MSGADLVSVIIPAFNAAATIDETLCSVRFQTHRRLEILVVDDGSEDATSQIVERHAAKDQRIRLIQQLNSGVAAARNRGIAEAAGDYVALIDADDLWRPAKIEKLLACLHRGGQAVALVYDWNALIDANGRIFGTDQRPTYAGNVIHEIVCSNFVGSGSTALMRKAASIEAGGFDTNLKGVEDWLLCIRIAARHEFAVVPEHLTGYRFTPTAMSNNVLQFMRSRDLLAHEICNTYPDYLPDIERSRLYFINYLYWRSLVMGNVAQSLTAAKLLFFEDPINGTKLVFLTLGRIFCRRRVPTVMLLFFRSVMRDLGIFGSLVEKFDREIARRQANLRFIE